MIPKQISDKEIEQQALTFAKEESYGELNADLWKGYVFGAKRIREQLTKSMSTQLIGHVGVDSGQLLLCDPCYIDSQWVKEDFEDLRRYQHKDTKKQLTYRLNFGNYQEVIPDYNKNMNELLETGEWEEVPDTKGAVNPFSYNACCKATLSEDGHGQLKDEVGVAFSTAFGDGIYPVVAHYMDDGTLRSVEVVFQND
jgi:hypothetical protein